MQSVLPIVSRKVEFMRQKLLNRKQQLKHWQSKVQKASQQNLALKYIFLNSFGRQKMIKLRINSEEKYSQSGSSAYQSHYSQSLSQKNNSIIENSFAEDQFHRQSNNSNCKISQSSHRQNFPHFPKTLSPIPLNHTNTKSQSLFENQDPMLSSFTDENIDPNYPLNSNNVKKPFSKFIQNHSFLSNFPKQNIAPQNYLLRKSTLQKYNQEAFQNSRSSFIKSVSPVKIVKEIYCQNCQSYLKPFQFFTHTHDN